MSFHPNLMLPEIVLPHLNWRGAYESGAFLSTGGPKGRCIAEPTHEPNDWEGIYIPSPSNPDDNQTSPGPDSVYFCVEVSWPAQSQWMTHLERPLERGANGPRNWMGSLIEGGKDISGQMYMRNRYYDPSSGKFTQEDPIGLAGGINVYGFANGDPVNFSDPYGLSAGDTDNQQQPGKEPDLGRVGNRVRDRCGTEQLCRDLITHYARGRGNLRLTDATFQDVVRVAADAEVTSEKKERFNGIEATAKVINFYGTKYENALGRATVYYNAEGEAIGFRDRVDFEEREWGVRPYFGEVKTRMVNWALGGTPFDVTYSKRNP